MIWIAYHWLTPGEALVSYILDALAELKSIVLDFARWPRFARFSTNRSRSRKLIFIAIFASFNVIGLYI